MSKDELRSPDVRPIRTAELLAVGSELTSGETRDTNGPELAASLSSAGVDVRRILALPDRLSLVTDTFRAALGAVDLVVATGGLGPTPDDLTREALAGAVGEEPSVDPELEAGLRALFERRGIAMPAVTIKQAWRIPSATSIPNQTGTAPGWWVDRADGRVAILLPGPPREMRPMWSDWVLPRLRARGLGDGRTVRTLRTYGIGEGDVADRLGDAMLLAANPVVATYAKPDWLDIRISAVDSVEAEGRPISAAELLDATEAEIRSQLGEYVWAEGETSWPDLFTEAAARADARVALLEAGTRGALGALLADSPWLRQAVAFGSDLSSQTIEGSLDEAAAALARSAGADVGLALTAEPTETGTYVRAGLSAPNVGFARTLDLRLFQRGAHGRFRAAVAATAFTIECLRKLAGR